MKNKISLKTILAAPILLTVPSVALAQNAYKFLEIGLFGTGDSIDFTVNGQFETFIKSAYTLFLTICIVTATIMIVIHGLEYMLTSIPMSKVKAKGRLWSAISGLLIALTAWLFLYTLNPKLVDLNLNLNQIDTSSAASTNTNNNDSDSTTDPSEPGTPPNYPQGGKYNKSPLGSDMESFKQALDGGQTISNVSINTKTKKITFTSSGGQTVTRDIQIGQAGYSGPGQGQQGDNKTPTGNNPDGGNFSITSDIRVGQNGNEVRTRNGQSSLGAAFINIGAKDQSGKDRGIGIHGKIDNSLRPTNGCVRMHNEDLEVIGSHIKPGTSVTIT